MRKSIFLVLILFVASVGLFAETPQYFAFELGAGGAYNIDTGDIVASNQFGFSYTFDQNFSGGYSFIDISGTDVSMINITLMPVEDLSITMYTGNVAGLMGFGTGIGYNIFSRSDGLYSSLGLYFNWFASDGGVYDIANGGAFSFGMKTSIGI